MQNTFLNPPTIESVKSALFIQPHPDDNEIAAGGCIARMVASGCKVYSVTVTDGRLGGDHIAALPDKVAKIRQKEAQAAARILQIEQVNMKTFKDQTRASERKIAKRLASAIDRIAPEAIFYPDPNLQNEWHQDHIKVGRAVELAAAMIKCNVAVYAQYFTKDANTTINIEPYYTLKMQAVKCHESQITEDFLILLDHYYAELAKETGYKHAEKFKVLSRLHTHSWIFDLNYLSY